MSLDRVVRAGGVDVSSAAGLAHMLWHRHSFAGTFERVLAAARVIWQLENDNHCQLEVNRAMTLDYTAGNCAECGQGFRQYLFCNGECRWAPGAFTPTVTWPAPVEAELLRQQLRHSDGATTPTPQQPADVPSTGWI